MYSTLEKLKCLERELAMRRGVYKRRVASGQMKQEQADREIALMSEIVLEYRVKCLSSEPTSVKTATT